MAQEQVNIDLIIETAESARNLGELKKSMNEVRGALDKVAVGSKEFGKLNAALDDGAQRLRTFRRGFDGLQAFETFGRTIASSFALASGAIAQFAGDNDELQKSLTRVGSALALLQGFSGLAESMKAAREANLALNASLLTNPYVLVAAGIAAVALALVTQTSNTKEATKAQEEYNAALQEMYAGMASGVIQDYTTEVDNLYLLNLSQKDLLEQTVAIREKELSQVESLTFFTSALSVQREALRDKESKLLQVRKDLANTSTPQLIQKEKELTAQVKQLKVDISDLTKANKDLFDARKALSDFNTKDVNVKEKEVKGVEKTTEVLKLNESAIYDVIDSIDKYIKTVEDATLKGVLTDVFTESTKSLQANTLAVKNNINDINKLSISSTENLSKLLGSDVTGGALVEYISKLEDRLRKTYTSLTGTLNIEFFKTPSDYLKASEITIKENTENQVTLWTAMYQRIIKLGKSPEYAKALLGNRELVGGVNGLTNKQLMERWKLTEDEAKQVNRRVDDMLNNSLRSFTTFSKNMAENKLIPDDFYKDTRDKIKMMEGDYGALSDVLSHQEDVLKKVGATDKQISEERYNNLIKLKGELEKISEVVSSSILPDDEKSKKTEELTKRINDLRQSLELLGIELGKPKEDNTFVESLNETVNILNALNSVASQTADIFQRASDNRLQTLENEKIKSMAIIDDMYNRRLISDSQYQEKVNVLNEEYRLKEKEEKKQAFEAEKAGKVVSAIINTALAVTSALTAGPIVGFVLAGITAALGAVQVGLIASQPTPEFAQGGFVAGPGGGKEDQIDAKLSNGEYIVNSNATKRFRPLLDQINYGFIGVQNDNGKLNNNNTNNSSNISPINNSDIKVVILQSELEMANKKSKDIKTRVNF